ncbi:hypothetical protein MXB_2234, partial [Myxobolus squamalis]
MLTKGSIQKILFYLNNTQIFQVSQENKEEFVLSDSEAGHKNHIFNFQARKETFYTENTLCLKSPFFLQIYVMM